MQQTVVGDVGLNDPVLATVEGAQLPPVGLGAVDSMPCTPAGALTHVPPPAMTLAPEVQAESLNVVTSAPLHVVPCGAPHVQAEQPRVSVAPANKTERVALGSGQETLPTCQMHDAGWKGDGGFATQVMPVAHPPGVSRGPDAPHTRAVVAHVTGGTLVLGRGAHAPACERVAVTIIVWAPGHAAAHVLDGTTLEQRLAHAES